MSENTKQIELAIETLVYHTKRLIEKKRKIDEARILKDKREQEKTFKIKTQEDFSKKHFPEYQRDKSGFALQKKDFYTLFIGKLPYGPMPYMKGMSSLAVNALIQWDGRNQEINQWVFQNDLVKKGLMRESHE